MSDKLLDRLITQDIELEGWMPLWYWTHGHADKALMVTGVAAEWGTMYVVDDVEHTYFRNIPVGPSRPGETLIHLAAALIRLR